MLYCNVIVTVVIHNISHIESDNDTTNTKSKEQTSSNQLHLHYLRIHLHHTYSETNKFTINHELKYWKNEMI